MLTKNVLMALVGVLVLSPALASEVGPSPECVKLLDAAAKRGAVATIEFRTVNGFTERAKVDVWQEDVGAVYYTATWECPHTDRVQVVCWKDGESWASGLACSGRKLHTDAPRKLRSLVISPGT